MLITVVLQKQNCQLDRTAFSTRGRVSEILHHARITAGKIEAYLASSSLSVQLLAHFLDLVLPDLLL